MSAAAAAGTPNPQAETPKQDAPSVEVPAKAETPKAEAPKAETPKAETPAPGGETGAPKGEPKAPETYALKLPEGSEEWLEASDIANVEALAKAKGWTNEQAQAALDDHADALAQASARYLVETTADPDYGGDKLPETQRLANKALDFLRPAGTPRGDQLRKEIRKTGYGNSIVWVSLLADIGKQMDEDRPAGGRGTGGAEKATEDVLYDKK